jgi:allantoin racemase
MKIRYIIPGPIGKTELGAKELQRRGDKLKTWAFSSTDVDIVAVDKGPASIESMYEEYLAIPETAKEVLKAQAAGFDAAIIGCFGDPGLDGFREITDMLVVGPAGASIALATTLGHRFSILTVTDSIMGPLRRLVWEAGALDKLASIRAIDVSVIDLNKDHEGSLERMIEAGKAIIAEDKAEVIVLGCMSMGFLDVAEQMTKELGIPVVNPSKASLKVAEGLVACNLSHSKKAYMTPPKIEAGLSIEDLYLS